MYRDAGHHTTTQQQPCFLPEECLSFAQSLHLYTLGAAYAAGTETHQGDIKQGWFNVAEVDSHGKISIIITSIEHDMISGEFRQKLVLSIHHDYNHQHLRHVKIISYLASYFC